MFDAKNVHAFVGRSDAKCVLENHVGAQIDNGPGVTLAEAIKKKKCLKSLTSDANGTQIDNSTGFVLALILLLTVGSWFIAV